MKQDEIQKIILELIPTFLKAGEESIELFNKKLKINTKHTQIYKRNKNSITFLSRNKQFGNVQ